MSNKTWHFVEYWKDGELFNTIVKYEAYREPYVLGKKFDIVMKKIENGYVMETDYWTDINQSVDYVMKDNTLEGGWEPVSKE